MTSQVQKTNQKTPFRQGVLDGLIFFPILAPFSILFGVFASDLDLSFLQTLGFSFGVFAGAAQFASLSLLNDGAPIFIALLAGFTLNLRFILYSANMSSHFNSLSKGRRAWLSYLLVDQSFVLSDNNFPKHPAWSALEKSQYFLGIMAIIGPPWHVFTILGYFTGTFIPPSIDIAYALPLSFIALIMPALKTPAHWLAAIISITITLLLHDLPYNLGLIIAAILAIFAAGQCETWQNNKGNPKDD